MITVIDCEQGSPEWFAARLGIPTASCFSDVLAGGKGLTRRTYMLKLAGEIITGEQMASYSSPHMERGKAMESEARAIYSFMSGLDTKQVGFVRNETGTVRGCSPDSLIGNDGMLEIKTALPHILGDIVLKGTFPSDHTAQCQGNLWTAEREWIDLFVYWPKMKPFKQRAYRDEPYIANLSNAVRLFNEELQETVDRLRSEQ